MNFININKDNTTPVINLSKINIQQDPVQDIVITPVKVELPTEEKKEGCIQAEYPVTVCSDKYFSVENLFSELTDDYQRAIIRQNLGILGSQSIVWGNIEGNLSNQKDLYTFIQKALQSDEQGILDKVNLELKYWTQQIENKIESLASNITSLEIIPRYGTTNQLPVNVLVVWSYDQEVEAQAINGIAIDPSLRSYIFENVNDTLNIRLSYYYNNTWLARNIKFEVSYPIFYGTSENIQEDNYTISTKIKVTAGEGEYIYIFSKNEIDISVNGLIGGFEEMGTTYISDIRYYIYKSFNSNLGKTTVIINDKE